MRKELNYYANVISPLGDEFIIREFTPSAWIFADGLHPIKMKRYGTILNDCPNDAPPFPATEESNRIKDIIMGFLGEDRKYIFSFYLLLYPYIKDWKFRFENFEALRNEREQVSRLKKVIKNLNEIRVKICNYEIINIEIAGVIDKSEKIRAYELPKKIIEDLNITTQEGGDVVYNFDENLNLIKFMDNKPIKYKTYGRIKEFQSVDFAHIVLNKGIIFEKLSTYITARLDTFKYKHESSALADKCLALYYFLRDIGKTKQESILIVKNLIGDDRFQFEKYIKKRTAPIDFLLV